MWLILLSFALVLVAYLETRKPKNFPPGPPWFPIFGCALELRRLRMEKGSLGETTRALMSKYGPVVGARVGCERVVFVGGSKATQELLSRDDLNARPDNLVATSRTGGKRRGIIFTDSQFLQEQKKFVLRHFKATSFRKEAMVEMLEEEVRSIIDDLEKAIDTNSVVDLHRFFRIHVLNAFCFLMTGQTSNHQELSELEGATEYLSKNVPMSGPAFGQFPFLRYICPDLCGYNMFVEIHENILSFFRKRVKDLRETPRNSGLIHSYLAALNSGQSSDSFSEDQLLAICMDILIAGYDSICNALKFTFLYLILHPDIQQKAQEEIDSVTIKGRLPTLADKPKLPYVECIALESLRMFAGRSSIAPRRAIRDTQFNGYIIPKGTTVIGHFQGTLMDEEAGWGNPEHFDPGRFLRDGRVKIPDNFIPFGLGKRRCVGELFSRANVFLVIAGLLKTFNFETVPGNPATVETVENFTPSVEPYKTRVTLR